MKSLQQIKEGKSEYLKDKEYEDDQKEQREKIEKEISKDSEQVNERKVRFSKKMKNSAKVVRETTEELFGKEGTQRQLADKIFKIFKREVRRKSKELGVPISQVRQWKITLRDYDNAKQGTTVAGKRPR